MTVREEKDFSKLDQLNFPVVIKPCATEYLLGTQAPRARMLASRAPALVACRATLSKVPEVIVQEWVDGAESDIYFCLQYRGQDGATIISFTGRKLRCWPPQTGSTARCTSAPEYEEHLERLTTDFFTKVGCVGMCSMEYKKDRRTGQFVMIEPTVGRTDWQEEVAMLNGVNIPFAAYCYETHRHRQPSTDHLPLGYGATNLITGARFSYRARSRIPQAPHQPNPRAPAGEFLTRCRSPSCVSAASAQS